MKMVCISRRGCKVTQKPKWTFPVGEILPAQVATNPVTGANTGMGSSTAVLPSESSCSTTSRTNTNDGISATSVADDMHVIKILSRNKKLVDQALRERDATERLRIARAMLYTAFLKAL